MNTINDLREFVYGKAPGDEVELEVIRGESRKYKNCFGKKKLNKESIFIKISIKIIKQLARFISFLL